MFGSNVVRTLDRPPPGDALLESTQPYEPLMEFQNNILIGGFSVKVDTRPVTRFARPHEAIVFHLVFPFLKT